MSTDQRDNPASFVPDSPADTIPKSESVPQPVPILTQLADGQCVSVNNFDGDKMNRYRLTQIACGPTCLSFDDAGDNIIDLRYYFAHVVELPVPNTGELVPRVRVVWMDEDGKAIGCVSDFLARETDTIISIFGPGPWNPSIKMQIVKSKSKRNMSFYTCRPVVD